jgi:hypothetical protein
VSFDPLPQMIQFNGRFGGGAADRTGDFGYSQGQVIAWDFLAGTNTIQVGGAPLPDLPSLLGPEAILLRPGDSVALLRFRSTFFVIGRISAPGDDRGLGVEQDRVDTIENVTAVSPLWGDATTPGPSVQVYVGSSCRARVTISAYLGAQGRAGLATSAAVEVKDEKGNTIVAAGANNRYLSILDQNATAAEFSGSRVIVLKPVDGLVQGLCTFTMKYRRSLSGLGTSFCSNREIEVQPF